MKLNTKKSARYFWCTLAVATIAMCSIVIYISFIPESKQVTSSQTAKDYPSNLEQLMEEKCVPVCDSKECVYQSEFQLGILDPDVDPCENFHQFACGGLYKRGDPYEKDSFTVRYSKQMAMNLKNMLDTLDADPETVSGKMKTVYNSCMKYSSSDLQAVPTILQFLHNLGIPGWPNLPPDFKFVESSITEVIPNFLIYEEYAFVEFTTRCEHYDIHSQYLYPINATESEGDADETESSYKAFLDCTKKNQTNISLNQGKSVYEDFEKPSRKYLVGRILDYFNMDLETTAVIWEESEAILDAIVNLRKESEKVAAESETPSKAFLDCTKKNEENNWIDLCRILQSIIETANAKDKVNMNHTTLDRKNLFFMQNIFTVLANFSDRSIANYLAINVIINNMKELNFYFQLTREKVEHSEKPVSMDLRWRKCVDWLTDHMTLGLGHEYLKKVFTMHMIREVQGVAEECIREALDLISHQEWMTEDLKTKANESLAYILDRLPLESLLDYVPNETIVNGFYEQFHPIDGNFLRNVIEYKKYFKTMDMLGLLTPELTNEIHDLFVPDAYNHDGVDIRLGMLLHPTYMPGSERLINLVSVGLIILHEFGHNLKHKMDRIVGSDPNAVNYYKEKNKCLENQYTNFTLESIGKKLDGGRLILENVADVAAINIIDKLIKKHASEDSSFYLPSSSLSLKQQMYVSSVLFWCSIETEKDDEIMQKFDIHSPHKFRIIGTLQNSRGFSEAFGCQNGSYMNPFSKCNILND